MTDEEINQWVKTVGPAPDDVFAKIVLRFAKAAREGNLKFDEIDPQSGDK
ncbi:MULTISPECIES: hypothetical protein [Rhodococcus]|uniref:Uncharacterized protein n=2 Tax=Rhodococcus opacus TaxID=37919 RepID=C1BC11_RHOOB|nr:MULTISPECIES: hypothetical protein [Rhodococcus]EID75420.1 hypothetical protein W59_27651 [Rhodococcus opacus RKJ300 = JCM 13270]KAF0957957.1 hypothetical protein MLGJGCBP_09789 [Rhodococcus sp. T7]KAF0960564.1 hypothetical protein MLGJGCBP_06293 [Rhodococcus sp. T7]QQZ18634.1 hypothetical protein GO592_41640 [Rhodococcus sp. 21391]UOT07890.1 hypothetical protein MPY17_36395 [Rhodococcus opacus]